MQVEIVPTLPEHIAELRHALRDADLAELAAFGISPNKSLWFGYKNSLIKRTALVDGKVAAIWGCGGAPLAGKGTPWLLTSNVCELVSSITFAKIYKKEVQMMLKIFPKLENIVDSNYCKSIRMLKIIGFNIGDPAPSGNRGAMFRAFSMEAA